MPTPTPTLVVSLLLLGGRAVQVLFVLLFSSAVTEGQVVFSEWLVALREEEGTMANPGARAEEPL